MSTFVLIANRIYNVSLLTPASHSYGVLVLRTQTNLDVQRKLCTIVT